MHNASVTGTMLYDPALAGWAMVPRPDWIGWIGVAGYAFGTVWLSWMFVSLGRNLTDTVVARADAQFVESGPYRYVRNPMYSGVLIVGVSLGLAMGTWLVPLGSSVVFCFFAARTRIEERCLIARFGGQYRDYMSRVGRFFPTL